MLNLDRLPLQLKPGDMYATKDTSTFSDWKTVMVVAIDHGQMATKPGANDGRPASITLLVDGPRIVQMPFGFMRNYIKMT